MSAIEFSEDQSFNPIAEHWRLYEAIGKVVEPLSSAEFVLRDNGASSFVAGYEITMPDPSTHESRAWVLYAESRSARNAVVGYHALDLYPLAFRNQDGYNRSILLREEIPESITIDYKDLLREFCVHIASIIPGVSKPDPKLTKERAAYLSAYDRMYRQIIAMPRNPDSYSRFPEYPEHL